MSGPQLVGGYYDGLVVDIKHAKLTYLDMPAPPRLITAADEGDLPTAASFPDDVLRYERRRDQHDHVVFVLSEITRR